MLEYSWLIPLFPLISFVLIIFFGKRMPGNGAYVSIAAVGISFLISIGVLIKVLGGELAEITFEWVKLGNKSIQFGMLIDQLTAVMLMVVTIVSGLVQIYSIGYMHGDPRYSRYFAYLSLFTFSMLGLVLANNFLEIFVFWELVGLTSYLLIGFWFERKSAADAGKKAFITTRIGDAGFFIGMLLLFYLTGTFNFHQIFEQVEAGYIAPGLVTATGLLIFCGAIGKSAQFPLHVWLPDAMEGPSPVSALIHAATMVAAGVYLVARTFTIFLASPSAMLVVAYIGGVTAFMAASIGLVQNDIKRVLAYSTISQLGYMMLALGVGGYTAGIFHLYTHAFFKALLFLAAGSVIHAVHTNDIQEMGGLFSKMKVTAITFIIASLSISGIPPLSGFWSKDEILLEAFHSGNAIVFILAITAAFMTAFYMFRLVFITFFGSPRARHKYEHAHESSPVMTIPLCILAVLSVCAGWFGIPWLPHGFSSFVYHGHHPHHMEPSFLMMFVSIIVAGSGILLAYAMYYKGWISPQAIGQKFALLYRLLFNKYWFDEIYNTIIVQPVLRLTRALLNFDLSVIDGLVNLTGYSTVAISEIKNRFDLAVIDGAVNGVAFLTQGAGTILRRLQTGLLQNYMLIILFGVIVILFIKLL